MIDRSAKKALSLGKDRIFKLLLAMLILLGWIGSLSSAMVHSLQQLYHSWQLEQQRQLTVYLLPEPGHVQQQQLVTALKAIPDIKTIRQAPEAHVKALVADYFAEDVPFDLPIMLKIEVKPSLNRTQFDNTVWRFYPGAKIDDARDVLARAASLVRLVQYALTLVAVIMGLIIALLVIITVQAGLRRKRRALAVMQYVGATDHFINHLVVRQIAQKAMIGGFMGVSLSALSLYMVSQIYPELAGYIVWQSYTVTLVWPVILVLIVVIAAWLTCRRLIVQNAQNA